MSTPWVRNEDVFLRGDTIVKLVALAVPSTHNPPHFSPALQIFTTDNNTYNILINLHFSTITDAKNFATTLASLIISEITTNTKSLSPSLIDIPSLASTLHRKLTTGENIPSPNTKEELKKTSE